MLVLACGVIVALVAYFDVDLTGVTKLKDEQLKPIEAQKMPEDIGEGGSYYVEAGIVYIDPNTGQMYIVEGEKKVIEENDAGSQNPRAYGAD
jgi:hypothetical protein